MHLNTPRLELRGLEQRDQALYCRLYTDPEVMRHIAAPLTAEAALRAFRAACRLAAREHPGSRVWAVVERSTEPVGIVAVMRDDAEPDEGELGIMLLPSGQGRGLATEALAAAAAAAFSDPRLQQLRTRHAADNHASVRLMSKLGYARAPGGVAPDELRWQLSRKRWEAQAIIAPMAEAAEAG